MAKDSDDVVVVAEVPVDVEAASQEAKPEPKSTWLDRFRGVSDLDVKERKYVRKVDTWLL